MSSRSFRSVFMVASCAGAALGCYLVSLRVASERAALEKVETEIVMAQRDIRVLQTEIGTRGRLAQLERWNVKVLALSAPSADQFLEGGFALAKMVAPRDRKVDLDAPVVLAAAPANEPKAQIEGTRQPPSDAEDAGVSARDMMHVASLKRPTRPVAIDAPAPVKPAAAKPAVVAKAKPEKVTPSKKPAPAAKALAKAESKLKPPSASRKAAPADPLAPLTSSAKPKAVASTAPAGPIKENGSKQ